MARFDPTSSSLNLSTSLTEKVCVITGGASGIGAATVALLASHGAHVVYGDVQEGPKPASPNVTFVKCDVTKYEDIVDLFKTALHKHGRVDHAISNAGVLEKPGWFDPKLGIDGVNAGPPTMEVLDVNLKGSIWFAHVAVQYLAHGVDASDENPNKSLTLISSLAGFKETPGIFVYQSSKFGVLGLLRTLRLYLPKTFKGAIRINAICPGMTLTPMVDTIKDRFLKHGNPSNRPEDVARVIAGVCAAGKGSQAIWYDGKEGQGTRKRRNRGAMDWDNDEKEARGMSGRSLVVVGGEAWDMEEGLDRTEDLWLGLSISDKIEQAQAALGIGDGWVM